MFWVTKGGDDESAPDDQDRDGAREDLYLISTSEITLAGSVRDTITAQRDLPLKLTAHTPCFRSEAGSGGRDVRGMIRQHQFDKVDMVKIVHPEQTKEALEELVGQCEQVMTRVKVRYRVVLRCAGEMGGM